MWQSGEPSPARLSDCAAALGGGSAVVGGTTKVGEQAEHAGDGCHGDGLWGYI